MVTYRLTQSPVQHFFQFETLPGLANSPRHENHRDSDHFPEMPPALLLRDGVLLADGVLLSDGVLMGVGSLSGDTALAHLVLGRDDRGGMGKAC